MVVLCGLVFALRVAEVLQSRHSQFAHWTVEAHGLGQRNLWLLLAAFEASAVCLIFEESFLKLFSTCQNLLFSSCDIF